MAQAFIPDMKTRGHGRFIAINTECALQNTANQSAYVAGKRGMDGVLRVLAREVGEHGITVNQVAPGWMGSENRPTTGRPDWYVNGIPLKRWGNEQDIANAVAFLASDLAGYITGVFLPVCGGNTMTAI
jgi:3-oxoacyl-[acyl-carrier protein] reductase